MKDFRHMINNYLLDHKKQKKYLAIVLALSILVTFAVPLSLMQPAESMTIDRSHLAEEMAMADPAGALNLLQADQWTAVINYGAEELFYGTKETGKDPSITTKSATTTEDSVDLEVFIEYAFKRDIREWLAENNEDGYEYKAGPHLYWDLGNTDLTAVFPNGETAGDLFDRAYSQTVNSGTYEIKDGVVYLTLTEDYVENYVCRPTGDGSLTGTLQFNARLDRDESESGDQEINIAGQEITVEFPDKKPTVSKTARVDEYEGTIEWTLTVNNSFNLDLSSYTMSDRMLANAKDVTISPESAADFDGTTINFTEESKSAQFIFVTYKTDITEAQLKGSDRENEVILKNEQDGSSTSAKVTANFYKAPFSIGKTGKPDYETDTSPEGYGNQIDWTITINNEYGVSLDGYVIRDEMLEDAVGAIVVSPAGSIGNDTGEWTLSGVGNAKQVTIKYRAPVVGQKDANGTITVKNPAKLYYPSDVPTIDSETTKPAAETTGSVDYKSESDMYSLDKTSSYDRDSHKINWTITANSSNNRSLKGYELIDDAFAIEGLNIQINPSHVTYTLDGNKLTITSDYSGWLQLKYTTEADMSVQENTTATMSNTVSDNKGHEKTHPQSYEVRNTLQKYLSSSNYGSAATSGAVTKTLNWTANIVRDGKFAGTVYSDKMSVDRTNASHSMTDAQLNAISLSARVTEYGQSTTLVRGTADDYTKNGDVYTFTNENVDYVVIPNDTKTGFEIVFSPKMDAAGYNYVSINYATTATINAGKEYGEYKFSNGSGFAGVVGPNPSYTFNKTNPEVFNKMDANVQKNWNSDNSTVRPANAYFKLQYQTNVDSEWRTVRGSGENYLLYGSDGYDGAPDYLITLNNENQWKLQLTGLPKEVAKANADGTQGTMVQYSYRILEVEASGNLLENNMIRTADGFYHATYSCWNDSLSCTNTFYAEKQITPQKQWANEGSGTNFDSVTVQLQYSTDWTNWYPVKIGTGNSYVFDTNETTDGTEIANQVLTPGTNWQAAAWNDLPAAYLDTNGNIRTYNYRIREISVKYKGTEIATILDASGNGKLVVDNGYYTIEHPNGENNTVKNTFHKTSDYTITGQKVWNGDESEQFINNRPAQIIVQLQQKQADGTWQDYGDERYLNSDNNWQFDFTELPNQAVAADGTVTKYTYKLLEIGYVKDRTEYRFTGNVSQFATTEEGYYTIAGSGNPEIGNAGTLTITNTFNPATTVEITPQKKWVGDDEFVDSDRPDSVKFTLQCNIAGAGWVNCKLVDGKLVTEEDGSPITDPVVVTLDENSVVTTETQIVWENSVRVEKTTVFWTEDKIAGLPQTIISINEDGSCSVSTCRYRFKETAYNPADGDNDIEIDEDDDYFKTFNGRYNITVPDDYSSQETYTITNTFNETAGIIKQVLDKNGNPIKKIEKDDLATWPTIIENEKEYYVFNWLIEFEAGSQERITAETFGTLLSPVIDVLPDGFTLCTDSTRGSATFIDSPTVNGTTVEECLVQLHQNFGDYYPAPVFTWRENFAQYMNQKTSESELWDTATANNYFYYKENYDGATLSPTSGTSYSYVNNVNQSLMGKNIVIFNRPVTNISALFPLISYSTKVEKSYLDQEIEKNSSFTFSNFAERYTLEGTKISDTGATSTASLKIINKQGAPLITKACTETALSGEFIFSLDINPEGKNLSTGSTIDITDLFSTENYIDQHYGKFEGSNLVDVLMSNVKLYTVDANGSKKPLPVNQYTLTFTSGSELSTGAALMELTIPDETHIIVEYNYSLIANANTPSVQKGCKSTTRVNGRYVTMTSGLPIPGGDQISFKNEASLKTESASASHKAEKNDYIFFDSSGTTATDVLPSIVKVRTGDHTINDLKAVFLLAKYENGQWFYAKSIDEENQKITWMETGADGTRITDGAMEIPVERAYPVSLEKDVLYKLVEISVPSGYEGSNLDLVPDTGNDPAVEAALENDAFKSLITAYLNNGTTTYNSKDYAVFLENFEPTKYFVYNSNVGQLPEGVETQDVLRIRQGDNIEIPNNELIDIGVNKKWVNPVDPTEGSAITVELYWSETKVSSGMPADVHLADAAELGIMDENFSAVQTIEVGAESNAKVWKDLPNGRNGKQIYYYIKETAYTIGDVTYTLDEDGVYKSEAGTAGSYLPTYVGNAASADTVIAVSNSYQLMLKKTWVDSANQPMKSIPVSKILVDIYGLSEEGLEIGFDGQLTSDPLFAGVELTASNHWTCDITNMLPADADLSKFKGGFRAEESSTSSLDTYVISCVFNLNGQTGEITVSNKNTVPTEAAVTVNKSWSDGKEMHVNDSIKVTLFQTTTKLPEDTWFKVLSSQYGAGTAPIMKPMSKDDKQQYQDYVLNAENDWTCTWTGLPMQNSSQKQYYYYVLETGSTVAERARYAAVYDITEQTLYKTVIDIENTRKAVVVQKQWVDESNNLIPADQLKETEITLDIYKKNLTIPEGGIAVTTLGDSITEGYATGYTGGYAPYLQTMLEKSGFTVNAMGKNGHSQHAIMNMPDNVDYTAGDYRAGIYQKLSTDLADETPDVACLLIGTNDIISNYQKNIDGRLETLIKEIYTYMAKDGVLFVSTIPKFRFVNSDNSTTESYGWFKSYSEYNTMTASEFENYINTTVIKSYNDKIEALVAKLAKEGRNIRFVDVYSVLNKNTDIVADGCHPNAAGDQKIASVWESAIIEYYSPSIPVGTITLTPENNWIGAFDITDNDANAKYYIEESTVPDGWQVSYKNNDGQTIGSGTPMTAVNKRVLKETSLEVQKTWVNDEGHEDKRAGFDVVLFRSTDKENWEELQAETDYTLNKTGLSSNVWTYEYTGLKAEDIAGNPYYYKAVEKEMKAYQVKYDNELVEANLNGKTDTLFITNTMHITLRLIKRWKDNQGEMTDPPRDKKIKVNIYRLAIDSKDSIATNQDLIFHVTDCAVSVGETVNVDANRTITKAKITEDDREPVTITSSGSYDGEYAVYRLNEDGILSVEGKNYGKATVEVMDDKGTAKTINVNVTALRIQLDSDDKPYELEAEADGTLVAYYNGVKVPAENVEFKIDSSTIDAEKITLNGNQLTVKGIGTVTVETTYEEVTTKQEINVVPPSTFVITKWDGEKFVEVTENQTIEITEESSINLSVYKQYGEFKWSFTSADGATVQITPTEGNQVTVTGEKIGTGTIVVTRNNEVKCSVSVKIVEKPIVGTIVDAKNGDREYLYEYNSSAGIITIHMTGSGSWDNYHIGNIKNDKILKDLVPVKYVLTKTGGYNATIFAPGNNWGSFTFSGDTGTVDVSSNTTSFANYSGDIGVYGDLSSNFQLQIHVRQTESTSSLTASSLFSTNPLAASTGIAPAAVNSGELVETLELSSANRKDDTNYWETTVELPVYDPNGKVYLYWVEEVFDEAASYDTSYLYVDGDVDSRYWINALEPINGEAVITIDNTKKPDTGVTLPSTGGTGTRWYYIAGMMMMLVGVAGTIGLKRRQSSQR